MKARFIGDPRDNFSGPDLFPLRGVVFVKNEWTSVADEALFAKLQAHNHFETRDAGFVSIVPELTADDTMIAAGGVLVVECADDGVIVGDPAPDVIEEAPTDEKAALIAQLDAIPGAEFDGRWGVPKLRQALEAARFMAGDED